MKLEGVGTLLIRSEPRCPADRERLGDYAVDHNHADRSQPMLNTVMDTRFDPVHRTWKSLWSSERRAEKALEKQIRSLHEAETALAEAFDALLERYLAQEGDSRHWLAPFLPPNFLTERRKPESIPAGALTPFLEALEELREQPDEFEAHFRQRHQQALAAHNAVKTARRSLNEARSERQAATESWDEAYRMYHLTVEFVTRSDPTRIRRWILPWPSPQNSDNTVRP